MTLSLNRFGPLKDRLWVFSQMGLARLPLARMDGLDFWKLCGSGTGEGFTPVPNTAVWGILAAWRDADAAEAGLARNPFRKWRARADEAVTLMMRPTSVRGAWSGRTPFRVGEAPPDRPIAALTRATIRAGALRRFWRREPDVSRAIGRDPRVLLKIGIGEVPWLHQVTFSVWPDQPTMDAFARSGTHAAAIAAVRRGGWFAEELYARFAVLEVRGTWGGRNPLDRNQGIAA